MAVTIQLLDGNLHLHLRTTVTVAVAVTVIGNGNDPSVDGAEATFADQERPAEAASCGFEVGKGEEYEVVGAAVGEELVESEGVVEVPRLGVQLGVPHEG